MSAILNNFIDQLNDVIPMSTKERNTVASIVETTEITHLMYERLCQLFITNPNFVNGNYDAHIAKSLAQLNLHAKSLANNPKLSGVTKEQDVKLEDYLAELEQQVDPAFVSKIASWSPDTKLYMYLHHIQLAHMSEFKQALATMAMQINNIKNNS